MKFCLICNGLPPVVTMKSRVAIIAILFLGCLSMSQTDAETLVEFRSRSLIAINNLRRNAGLNTLEMSSEVTPGAQEWAEYLVQSGEFDVSSDSYFGRGPKQILYRTYSHLYYTDNMIKTWLNIPACKAVILNPNWTTFGIGRGHKTKRPETYVMVAAFWTK